MCKMRIPSAFPRLCVSSANTEWRILDMVGPINREAARPPIALQSNIITGTRTIKLPLEVAAERREAQRTITVALPIERYLEKGMEI